MEGVACVCSSWAFVGAVCLVGPYYQLPLLFYVYVSMGNWREESSSMPFPLGLW